MATQSGATVTVHLSAPDTNPDTIADYQPQRLTDRNGPSLEVGELTSNEVSANRQETSIRSGFQQVTGQVGFELSHLADFVYTAATNKLDLAQTGATFSTTFAAGDLVSFDITGGISGNFTGTGVVLAAGLAATTISITVISGGLLAQADISEELFTAVGDVTDAGSPVEGFLAVGDVAAYYEITAPVAAEVGMVGVFQVGNGLGEVHKFVGRIGTKSVAGDTLFVMVEISGSLTAGADQSAASLGGELISRVRKDEMLYSAIRKGYPDAAASGLEQVFSGCTVNNLSMSIQPGSLVTGTADILGISWRVPTPLRTVVTLARPRPPTRPSRPASGSTTARTQLSPAWTSRSTTTGRRSRCSARLSLTTSTRVSPTCPERPRCCSRTRSSTTASPTRKRRA
jgi:hypothetical protein